QRQLARVDGGTTARDCLEVHLVTIDFDEHEGAVGVESDHIEIAGLANVVVAQFSGVAYEEKIDSLLRFDSFVDMFMAAPHRIDAVLGEKRHELIAKIYVRPMKLSAGVERMMEISNLPLRF